MATDVKVIYHYEDGSWWADSPDVERWSAAADELEDLITLVSEGVPFALETEDLQIEHLPAPDLMEIFSGRTAGGRVRVQFREAFFEVVNPIDVPNPTVLAAA
ncbi:MAG TPA: hypothetical protein VHV75_19260 [Solirubrobacteraceae bacterium]|jgi:predicted RNase H-like HicB family nuclease|nr:hypothetical protein [Solirubrobacteraceae bacterium]